LLLVLSVWLSVTGIGRVLAEEDEPTPTTAGEADSVAESTVSTSPTTSTNTAIWQPPTPAFIHSDWLRLNSGEWLRGEIKWLLKGKLEFESDELDTLEIDWGDVAELYSAGTTTLLLEGRRTVSGRLFVNKKELVVVGDEEQRFPRNQLITLVPGEPKEINYWSGKGSIGLALRAGNTEQADLSVQLNITRRGPLTRLALDYLGAFGEVNGEPSVNSHRASISYDFYLTRRLFLRPFFAEYYRDPFLNIDHRVTVGAGMGYTLIDRSNMEWDVEGGMAYQTTRSVSVEAGEDQTDATPAVVVGTRFDVDITSKIDFTLDYQATVGLLEGRSVSHHLVGSLSFEVTDLLDFDVSAVWDHTSNPRPDEDGVVPKPNDFRLTLGLGVEF